MSESRSPSMSRRVALELLGMSVAAAALPESAFAQAPPSVFPRGAIIRTLLKDYAPDELGGQSALIGSQNRQILFAFQHMVVPLGRVVELTVVSPDVIHSWWVPALGGKIDAIPGRTNHTWFKAQKLGNYEARCAELCGIEHAHMIGWVDVVTPAAFARFLATHTGASSEIGKEVFEGVCATCHGLSGQGDYGPPLAGNATIADTNALEQLLRNGKNEMPAVGEDWNDDTMQAATTYLKGRFGGGQG